ncbi:MAG: carboxylating nicotinate-nucleotide diphosphorylase [Pseudomonadales bacterium]|nr:carboxylating nicotinate-nucleotide diphosphorylase [Pseudomonadales bacterium]
MPIDYFSDLSTNVNQALAEDVGSGDITAALIDESKTASATVISRDRAIICGRPWVDSVFEAVDSETELQWFIAEGDSVTPGTKLFEARGRTRSLLTTERTALNFLQTLSGTATETHRLVNLISHTETTLLDTRKTLPGLRLAQKYAVHIGGGNNHRMGLFDSFLLKENHIAASGSIAEAITRARVHSPQSRLEIEVENLHQFRVALDAEPDWIMLDNFSLTDITQAVSETNHATKLEVSGGIEDEQELIRIAETGVDYISIGALTKHCRAVDLSMLLD